MNKNEAIEECKRYIARNDAQRARSVRLQELASMARNGKPEEAKRALRELDADRMNLTVYDGSKLEEAIKTLLKFVSA
jgi:hypothetical protein